jgi:transposase
MYQKIQACKGQGLFKAEIARKLERDPGTVAKYYDMSESEYVKYQLSHKYRDKVFEPFKESILEVYRENGCKKLSMSAVFDYLEEKESERLPGNEQTLRNYIRYLTDIGELTFRGKQRSYRQVPELPFGKQLQIDFGEYKMRGGLKLYIFASVLSASRYKYCAYQDKPFTTEDLICHLLNCFDYLGGIPLELVIDQDSVMVVAENHGDIIYTRDFSYFVQEMNLQMYVCRKADPETKGKVENTVGFVKSNHLSVRDFESVEQAQQSVSRWLKRRANGKISQATKRIPAEMIGEERRHLRPVKNSIFRKDLVVGREKRSVDKDCLISVGSSQYSVPAQYRNGEVDIYVTDSECFIFDRTTAGEIAQHRLSLIPGSKITARTHFRSTGTGTKELREEVETMFSLESWKRFVAANFKAYRRYVRDQCLEARRWFTDGVDGESLNQALEFCLEHETYSMSNLSDTYRYYKEFGESGEGGEDILKGLGPQLKQVARYKKDIRVSKRDIGVYKSLVSIILAVCR